MQTTEHPEGPCSPARQPGSSGAMHTQPGQQSSICCSDVKRGPGQEESLVDRSCCQRSEEMARPAAVPKHLCKCSFETSSPHSPWQVLCLLQYSVHMRPIQHIDAAVLRSHQQSALARRALVHVAAVCHHEGIDLVQNTDHNNVQANMAALKKSEMC